MGQEKCCSEGIKDDRLYKLETGICSFKLLLKSWKYLCFSMHNESLSTTIAGEGSELMRSGQVKRLVLK